MDIRDTLRSILNILHLDLNKSLEYDRLTKKIMRKVITPTSNCIDVGCHKGEMLNHILKSAPNGKHFAFEPIPSLFKQLQYKYSKSAAILPYALSDKKGTTTFNYVKNAPAYSGINKRTYVVENPDIEEITVEMMRLDDCIPQDIPIHFIKIDVEGGEFGVLKGAERIINESKPIILFESGLGASDFYGTTAEDIFGFLTNEFSMNIFTLKTWLNQGKPLTKEEFMRYFTSNEEYYFLACPKNS
ncbi:MAG: FkbM family methyltransferase [Ignavibacteriae bacterium]|nr:FkbM family methyltransferase [Ignavibacteriota bacterium]